MTADGSARTGRAEINSVTVPISAEGNPFLGYTYVFKFRKGKLTENIPLVNIQGSLFPGRIEECTMLI